MAITAVRKNSIATRAEVNTEAKALVVALHMLSEIQRGESFDSIDFIATVLQMKQTAGKAKLDRVYQYIWDMSGNENDPALHEVSSLFHLFDLTF